MVAGASSSVAVVVGELAPYSLIATPPLLAKYRLSTEEVVRLPSDRFKEPVPALNLYVSELVDSSMLVREPTPPKSTFFEMVRETSVKACMKVREAMALSLSTVATAGVVASVVVPNAYM